MSASLSHSFKRATAWVVLLAWLFALSAGVANACLLETQRSHTHQSAGGGESHSAPTRSAGHRAAQPGTGDHHDRLASKAPCQKVCDETAQSAVKSGSGPDVDSPGLTVALWSPWSARPWLESTEARRAATELAPPGDPPARVKYSRLVL